MSPPETPEPKAHESHSGSDATTTTTLSAPKDTIARITLNLRAHTRIIALQASIILFTSGILPLIGYLTLHYTTTLKTTYILSIFTPPFGLISLLSLLQRTLRLARPTSTCRPLTPHPSTRWALDYFNWNFIAGICLVSVIISIGISRNPSNVRIVSLPLALLLLQVCGQMVLVELLRWWGFRTPMRISSTGRGEMLRPAVFTIVEDVVSVDAGQGAGFRKVWGERWVASGPFRTLLGRVDWVVGVSGVGVAGGVIAVIFAVENDSVGWAVGEWSLPLSRSIEWTFDGEVADRYLLGWSVPWLWAGVMALITIEMTKSACRQENAMVHQPKV